MGGPSIPPQTWAPGATIPGTVYRIIRLLGQGGMGEVYEVEHDMLGTRRALKVLIRDYASRDDLTERLRVEARALARLKHPNLVEVYDLSADADGRIFFVMELLDGMTLRELLRQRGSLGAALGVRLMVQVLDGLSVAHDAHMLHRDVKPENIFICREGTVKLLDFGVAKAIDASLPSQQLTDVGMTVGTPRYMAPEQAEGRSVDARADIYSAGLVLWEALAGRPAFEDDVIAALVDARITRGVPPLAKHVGEKLPPGLAAAVERACHVDREHRWTCASDFAAELRACTAASGFGRQHASVPPSMRGDDTAPTVLATRAMPGQRVATGEANRTRLDAPDPAVQPGPTGTDPLPEANVHELTEKFDAVLPIDRDEATSAPRPLLVGPRGTQMFPSVAARHSDGGGASPVVLAAVPADILIGGAHLSSNASRSAGDRSGGRPAWQRWLAGLLAFTLPVAIALVIGFKRTDLRQPALVQPATSSVPDVPAPEASVARAPAGSARAMASAPPAPSGVPAEPGRLPSSGP